MVCDAGEFGNPAAGGVKYMKYSTRLRLVEYFIYFTPGPVHAACVMTSVAAANIRSLTDQPFLQDVRTLALTLQNHDYDESDAGPLQ